MTNFERITESPEALLDYMTMFAVFANCSECKTIGSCMNENKKCERSLLRWLNQESEDIS